MTPAQEKGARSFSVTVLPIACSFPWKNHPDALKLKELSDSWIVERCKSLSAACKGQPAAFLSTPTSLVGLAVHLLATLLFPNAVFAQLWSIVKMMTWINMLDTFVDDPSETGGKYEHAEQLKDCVLAVFEAEGQAAAENVPLEPMSAHGLLVDWAREWWQEMQLNMSPAQQARFSKLFTAYLNASRLQVPFRASLEMPDVHTYFRVRTESIACYPTLVLIEMSLGIELDEEALIHPQGNMCEFIFLVNDITSFGKEYTEGDLFNLVFLVCFSELGHRKLPVQNWQALLQEGVRKVSEMIKERGAECVRIIEEIQGLPVLMSKVGMEAYLEGVGHNLAGNVYWHLVSKRYASLCVPTFEDGHPDLEDGHPDLHAPLSAQLII